MTEPLSTPAAQGTVAEREYPKTIWVERDEETNEKRWFTIKGMGVEYVRVDVASTSASGVEAVQITMGRGLVDVTRIEHEGRSGILFRPRDQHIPVGQEGELQPGEYWPVAGDVVIWIENEGGAQVIADHLAPFLPAALTTAQAPEDRADD